MEFSGDPDQGVSVFNGIHIGNDFFLGGDFYSLAHIDFIPIVNPV